jgi:hypothetical protein
MIRSDAVVGEANEAFISPINRAKISGRAIYAVMSFGGFLGMGEKHHPLPWATLKYDTAKGGYLVNLDKKKLQDAPNHDWNVDFKWTPEYGRKVDSYYNATSYWN